MFSVSWNAVNARWKRQKDCRLAQHKLPFDSFLSDASSRHIYKQTTIRAREWRAEQANHGRHRQAAAESVHWLRWVAVSWGLYFSVFLQDFAAVYLVWRTISSWFWFVWPQFCFPWVLSLFCFSCDFSLTE